MTEKDMLKISVEEYKALRERYIDLKVILTASGVNLTEIDRIKA